MTLYYYIPHYYLTSSPVTIPVVIDVLHGLPEDLSIMSVAFIKDPGNRHLLYCGDQTQPGQDENHQAEEHVER